MSGQIYACDKTSRARSAAYVRGGGTQASLVHHGDIIDELTFPPEHNTVEQGGHPQVTYRTPYSPQEFRGRGRRHAAVPLGVAPTSRMNSTVSVRPRSGPYLFLLHRTVVALPAFHSVSS